MNIKNINGLSNNGCELVERIFKQANKGLSYKTSHHAVKGYWYSVLNPVTEDVDIIDGNTTVFTLLQHIDKGGL